MAARTNATPRAPMPAGYWVLWTAVVIDMIGFGIAIPVLGPYARERFGANGFTVGAIGAAFSLAQFLVAAPVGRLSDRVGRKPVLIVSLLGTAIASAGTAFAGSSLGLLIWRAIDGASGATVGVANAVVADIAEPERRAPLIGMLGAAFGIGFTVGPAIGSIASAIGGPRAPFLLAAGLAFANAIATAIRVPETRGLARAQSAAASDVRGLASTWREAGLPRLFAVSVMATFAFAGFEQTYSIFAEDRIGLTRRTIGFSLAFVGVIVMIVQGGLIRPAMARWSDARILPMALGLVALGFASLSTATGVALLVPGLLVLSIGQGFVMPSMSSVITRRIHPDHRGAVLGVQQSWTSGARVAGPLLGGLLFDQVGAAAPMVVAGLLFAAAGIGAAASQRSGPAPSVAG